MLFQHSKEIKGVAVTVVTGYDDFLCQVILGILGQIFDVMGASHLNIAVTPFKNVYPYFFS